MAREGKIEKVTWNSNNNLKGKKGKRGKKLRGKQILYHTQSTPRILLK